jgi:mannose-6-phosphate isomerase-like protein (cupin superfamily)
MMIESSLLHFMNEKEANGSGRLFAKVEIEPGSSIGLHKHENEVDVYYILKGKALVNDNGTEVVLEEGECNICLNGESHSVQNIGDSTLEFVTMVLFTKQKEV